MRTTSRLAGIVALFALTSSGGGVGCGGGAKDEGIPAGTCQRAAAATSGPGDAQNYFPAEVGRSWSYRVESTGATSTTVVTGTQPVGNETASVFTTTTTADPAVVTELVVKRPGGVYLQSGATTGTPLDDVYPSMILPFPVAVTPRFEIVRCHALDLGDLDGDSKPELADLVATLEVLSVNETAETQAGYWENVADVRTIATVTATSTLTGQSVTVHASEQDWYAQNVGRVVSLMTLTSPYSSESETVALTAWSRPSSVLASAPPAATAARSAVSAASPLEDAARQLAQRAVGR